MMLPSDTSGGVGGGDVDLSGEGSGREISAEPLDRAHPHVGCQFSATTKSEQYPT